MKLPKALTSVLISAVETEFTATSYIARLESKCQFLPTWVTENGIDYYKGIRDANRNSIECILIKYNQYKGFSDVVGRSVGVQFEYRRYFGLADLSNTSNIS